MLKSIKKSLRRAGFGLGGAVLMSIGTGFLTVAAWFALAEARDTQFAALVIGCAYFGLGAIVVALGAREPSHDVPLRKTAAANPANSTGVNMGGIGAAFAQGYGAGAATRSSMRGAR